MITYPAILDVPTRLVDRLERWLLRRSRRTNRRLSARQQAIMTLVYLRKGETFTALAAGFGIAASTAHGYVNEAVDVLRRHRRPLRQALDTQRARDHILVLDGTIVPTNRLWHRRGTTSGFYSGKHHCYGLNVQAITTIGGQLIWLSDPLPGAVHDTKAARYHRIPEHLDHRYLVADLGYLGLDHHVLTGYRRPYANQVQADVTADIAHRRAPAEKVFATLKNWRSLTKLRISPNHAWRYLAAISVCILT